MTVTNELLAALVTGIDAALPEAASIRRLIHADPHLGGDESDTRDAFIAETRWLNWLPVAETGAYARTGPDGPAVGLRAELDALPITEATGVEWASQRRGIMHACGHDLHMAALFALLTAARDLDLPVGMVPVLQPREEVSPPGASDVVASGVLEEAGVRAMVAVHVQPQVPRGVVSVGSGPVNAAFDAFQLTVTGKGGHGAYPHTAVNPVTVLSAIVSGLGGVTARSLDPVQPAALSVGTFHGGTAANVIPETATATGTLRTFNEDDRSTMFEAISRLAEGTALARGASVSTQFTRGGPALVNDATLAEATESVLRQLEVPVSEVPFRSCGSDDFSEFGLVVPSVMAFVGTGTRGGVGLHHSQFLPGRDALRLAAISLAAAYVAAASTLTKEYRS